MPPVQKNIITPYLAYVRFFTRQRDIRPLLWFLLPSLETCACLFVDGALVVLSSGSVNSAGRCANAALFNDFSFALAGHLYDQAS